MGYTLDDTGKPTLNDDATNPGPAGDFQAIVDYAEKVGGLLKMTEAERTSLVPGNVQPGWIISVTDTQCLYMVTASQPQGLLLFGKNLLTKFHETTALTGTLEPIKRSGVQTGTVTAGVSTLFSFPTAFPNECIGIALMPDDTSGFSGSDFPYLIKSSVTKTGFRTFWPNKTSGSISLPYIAYGC